MRSIDAEEARAQLKDVLREVKSGETVVATVRGVPVAQFVPVQERYEDAAEANDDLKRYRREHN
jgi:prevent-host-death family protein